MSSESFIKTLAIDDALYYPVIARSIAQGEGSSYDGGMTYTNGYHPLWCWLLVPVAWACQSLDPPAYLWWVKLVVVVVVALLLLVWYRLIQAVFGCDLPAAVFVLLLGGYWWGVTHLFSMLETPLVMAFIGLTLLVAHRILSAEKPRRTDAIQLGLAMGGAFLARLDSVFFLGCLILYLIWHLRRAGRWSILGWTAAVGAIVTIPYLVWNQVRFGSIVPVSGTVKTIGFQLMPRLQAYAGFWLDKVHKFHDLVGWIGVAGFALVTLGVIYVRRRELRTMLRSTWRPLWVLPISAFLHSLYTWIFMTQGHVSWYHYLSYLAIFLAAATLAQALYEGLGKIRIAAGMALIIGTLLVLLGGMLAVYAPRKLPNREGIPVYELAVWARETLPGEARFGMYDSGIFRYVSGRPTLALNGLVGDPELARWAVERNLRAMVERHAIDYVISPLNEEQISSIDPQFVVYTSDTIRKPGRGVFRYVVVGTALFEDPAATIPRW
jgi:hypothetical protein